MLARRFTIVCLLTALFGMLFAILVAEASRSSRFARQRRRDALCANAERRPVRAATSRLNTQRATRNAMTRPLTSVFAMLRHPAPRGGNLAGAVEPAGCHAERPRPIPAAPPSRRRPRRRTAWVSCCWSACSAAEPLRDGNTFRIAVERRRYAEFRARPLPQPDAISIMGHGKANLPGTHRIDRQPGAFRPAKLHRRGRSRRGAEGAL